MDFKFSKSFYLSCQISDFIIYHVISMYYTFLNHICTLYRHSVVFTIDLQMQFIKREKKKVTETQAWYNLQ
jgi:hypothetical protein